VKLLDTTVAVDYLRGAPAAVDLVSTLVESEEDVVASELVRFELLAGARGDELEPLEAFFSAFEWVPVGKEVAHAAGSLARRFRGSYAGIDDVDYLIAATAQLLDAELLTTNVRHFPMLEGLRAAY
jgi:predicted nucleic acid-binding protein